MTNGDFIIRCDERTGQVRDLRLFGEPLLDAARPCGEELWVNGLPLRMRLLPPEGGRKPEPARFARFQGERFVDHFTGWGLVAARSMGCRANLKHPCFGVQYHVRRVPAEAVGVPCPGPGGPPIEAPLHVDTFGVLNWNWTFWGEDTRMLFPSAHSTGPHDEEGHVGYEHDTPENCKRFLVNDRRRIYPGTMVVHGGVFYNARTEHWLALTCRRPAVGYLLNLENAGRGVAYDFTLHAPFAPGQSLMLPEIRIYFGRSREQMWSFLADYVTHYYRQPPDWLFKTLWKEGLAWNNRPTWREQGDAWCAGLDAGEFTGIGYSLVTNRPVLSGTTPTGYEPDPLHGTKEEFRAMCRRIADRGVPQLVWMSHAGMMPQGGPDIDDDWFIRGLDGRLCASWGTADNPQLAHVNPGHPGYIAYTKKWIRFYLVECGCRGIFFDCLGWAFPSDFRPRAVMRFPGDTNRMTIAFLEEIAAFVKECDPEAVLFGEGTTFDAPVDLVSLNFNPVRAVDGWGPRDFLLALNRYSPKRIVVDQGPRFSAAGGFVYALPGSEYAATNRAMAKLLAEAGGPRAFTPLPGDLAILERRNLLVVPLLDGIERQPRYPAFRLPPPWDGVGALRNTVDGGVCERDATGAFREVPPGLYELE